MIRGGINFVRVDHYCTTYCNKGHRLSDGKPVDHECRIIPPSALEAEMRGHYLAAIEIIQSTPFKTHRGVKS